MNWNQDKSVSLSMICVLLFDGLLLMSDIAAVILIFYLLKDALPPGYEAWIRFLSAPEVSSAAGSPEMFRILPFTLFWLCFSVPAWIALRQLRKILLCFRKNRVFEAETVRHMRIASWCCFGASAVCLFGGAFFPTLFIPSLAAAFMGLIVRIVKNSFDAAVRMKDELDLTV